MLIIYAHPNKEGHCGYILKKIQRELDNDKKNYEILNLYKINFNPILKNEEHYTSGRRKVTEKIGEFQDKIRNNKKFIIIYPTWWNSTPAILKGFFDRVLTMGFAFKYENKIPRGLLQGKVAVITTTGGPIIFEKFFAGNRSLKTVINDTLNFCGLKSKGFMIGSARELTEKQKDKIDKKIKRLFYYLKK